MVWQLYCGSQPDLNAAVMLKSYFKIALRNLWKHKFYSLINILGLALATAAFLFIIHFVRFEYSYENFHQKADDIYRVTLSLYKGSEYVVTDCETHPPLAPLLKKEMPEVVDYVRVQNMEGLSELKVRNEIYRVDKVYAADPSLFNMFSFEFTEGSPSAALRSPMQAVLTESLARRLFGSTAVIGQSLRNNDQLYTVSAVIKDVPLNTHLKFDMLISFSSLEKMGWQMDSWNGNNNFTYVQLRPHANLAAFNTKLLKLSRERVKDNRLVAESMKDIHLHSHKSFEPEVNGDIKTVQFLLAIAVLVLLVGSVNYVNLTTARAAERVKETGLRKVLGSSRWLLVKQFMMETFLLNLLALCVALSIMQLMLPAYLQLIGRPITASFFTSPIFWGTCGVLFLFNCLISGLYPAITLSSVKPVSVTQRTFTGSLKGMLLRKTLVVGQFAAALIVLSASLIVYRQLSYLRSQDLGMNTDEILTLRSPSQTDSMHRQAFRNSLLQLPEVEKVTVSGSLPGVSLHELATMTGIALYGTETGKGYNYYLYGIDARFLPAMEIKLAAGRNFREDGANKDEVIVSRETIRLLGFKKPEEAIGQKITLSMSENSKYSTIIGVMADYHQQSLKGALLPMIHWYSDIGSYYSLKISSQDIPQTLGRIKEIWSAQYPDHPFEYRFLNELFDQQYKADQQFGKIIEIFSAFTLFITCLGILGLTAYNINRRTKEIGIRKVLGASVTGIVTLLSKDFIKLVLIAVIIATPPAWYIMHRWLQNFAYRIEVEWWMFALAGSLTVIIALLTLSFQSVKAALVNPVRSLQTD